MKPSWVPDLCNTLIGSINGAGGTLSQLQTLLLTGSIIDAGGILGEICYLNKQITIGL